MRIEMICIEDLFRVIEGEDTMPYPKVGEKVTVIREEMYRGYRCSTLAEYPPVGKRRLIFDADAFAPISNIDERERLEAWQSERLTQEDRMLMALAEHMPDEQLDPVAEARIWKAIKATL